MADCGAANDEGPWKGPTVWQQGERPGCGEGSSGGRRPCENSRKAEKSHEGVDGTIGGGDRRRGAELVGNDDTHTQEVRGCT